MVGKNLQNSYEELSFGKIGTNSSEQKFPGRYVVFHVKTVPWKSTDLVGIRYSNLVNYIRGAYFGKFEKEFHMCNGISETTKDGLYRELEFLPLREKDLEKLIVDAEIPKRFKIKTTG